MANYTIAQLKAVGINPATTDTFSFPGPIVLEYVFDGSKRTTAATDTVDLYEIPALTGFVVDAAAVTNMVPGTATATIAVTLGAAGAAGTAVTGLTAWDAAAAGGTKLVKLATAANSSIATTTSNFVKLQIGTAGAGLGKYRVRVYGRVLEAPPV